MTRARALDLSRKLHARAADPSSTVGERAVATRRLRELVAAHGFTADELDPITSAPLDGLTWWRLLATQAHLLGWVRGSLRVTWRSRTATLTGPGAERRAAEVRALWATLEAAAVEWLASHAALERRREAEVLRQTERAVADSAPFQATWTHATSGSSASTWGRWAPAPSTRDDWLATAARAVLERAVQRERLAAAGAPRPVAPAPAPIAGLLPGPVAGAADAGVPSRGRDTDTDTDTDATPPGPAERPLDVADLPRPERRYQVVPEAVEWAWRLGAG